MKSGRILGGEVMLTVKQTNIIMNRCDSVYITVTVRQSNGEPYELQEGDKLYFAAKKKATDTNYAIAPKLLNGTVLELTPEDTESLDFGSYLYDVRLVTAKGYTTTIIKPSTLTIEESITGSGDQEWMKK